MGWWFFRAFDNCFFLTRALTMMCFLYFRVCVWNVWIPYFCVSLPAILVRNRSNLTFLLAALFYIWPFTEADSCKLTCCEILSLLFLVLVHRDITFCLEVFTRISVLMLEFLKVPFLVLHLSCYTLTTFLIMFFVILLSMLMIVLSYLSVIRHLICCNN